MTFPQYSEQKDTGLVRVPAIPVAWSLGRTKNIATYSVSNVDKHIKEDELPVRLCNYTDVYYNEYVNPEMELMSATAKIEEIRKFHLEIGDVVITKDSEDAADIGVPAMVNGTADDFVCGYHLAIIRPKTDVLSGRYLLRCLQSEPVNQHFQVYAAGVTRYGIPKSSIGENVLPLPSLDEQEQIARFLDVSVRKIDTLVSKKRELIELLQEKRRALVSRCVTRGLPPDAARAAGLDPQPKLKPSGVDWLGDVPEHWDTKAVRYAFVSLNRMRVPISGEDRASLEKIHPYYGASGIIDQVDDYIFDEPLILVAEDGANLLSRSTPLAFMATGKYWVNNHAHILRPRLGDIRFWEHALQTHDYTPLVTGAAQPKLTAENLGGVKVPCPPEPEQTKIADYLKSATSLLDDLMTKASDVIDYLLEYRSALITSAVTGKIDVREVEV